MIEEGTARQCVHLDLVGDVAPSTEGCQECQALGDSWVRLRLCTICGHVGCCDQSKNQHSMKHFQETGHPVIRSFEAGEDWLWCFVDKLFIKGPDLTVSKDLMRRLPLFAGLSDADLDRLYQMAEPVVVPAGQVLMEEGDRGDSMYVILDGELEVSKRTKGEDIILAVRGEGEYIGEMALLDDSPRIATVRTKRDSHLLSISQAAFQTLLSCSPTAALAVLHTVMSRLRSNESMLMQQEKMAALGTLAAGLAHELNNPAAAIGRSAAHLEETLGAWERLTVDLSTLGLGREQLESVRALRQTAGDRAPAAPLDPVATSEREDEVQDWLEDAGVGEAWELAPSLVSGGWDRTMLEGLTASYTSEQLLVVVRWLCASSTAYGLLSEVETCATSISAIVKAVKTYSYLDQAPIQDVDVHESLENTLIILRHKLKTGVAVIRDYAQDLPLIEAHGSDLNQVWTNLIDNAIDAMQGRGELVLRTSARDGTVVVDIQDSGPGIPAEVQERIYEPFFTTKPPGVGSGLGLHIAYNIVVHKHHGHISVISAPGSTCFRVVLPTQLA